MTVTIIFVWGYYGHFRINFNLLNVYEYRREARTYSMPLMVNYVFSASKTLFPILVVYMLYERKWFWSILCVIAQLTSFFVDGSKSTFFFLILALLGYYLYNAHRSKYLIWGFVCINIATLIENSLVGMSYVANMFIRRMLYVPSLLNYFYYDFFSSNEYDYFRQSFGDWFGLDSPYDISVSRLMGYKFFNEIETNK